jgi:hypothetical protein
MLEMSRLRFSKRRRKTLNNRNFYLLKKRIDKLKKKKLKDKKD